MKRRKKLREEKNKSLVRKSVLALRTKKIEKEDHKKPSKDMKETYQLEVDKAKVNVSIEKRGGSYIYNLNIPKILEIKKY